MSKKQARLLWSLAAQKINKHICVSEFLGLSVNKRHAPISWNYKVDSEGIQTLRWEATAWSRASLHHRSEPCMSCLWALCRFPRNESCEVFQVSRKVFSVFIADTLPFKQNYTMQDTLCTTMYRLRYLTPISWKLKIWASEVVPEIKNLAAKFMSKFSPRDLHRGGERMDSCQLSSDFY